jgi:hypothetical protein
MRPVVALKLSLTKCLEMQTDTQLDEGRDK